MKIHTYKPPYKDYYVAAFPSPTNNTKEMIEWCHRTFGEPGFLPHTQDVRWRDGIMFGEAYFARESDLMMFLLRWE